MEKDTPNIHTPPEGHAPPPPPEDVHGQVQDDLDAAFDDKPLPKKPN